MGPGDGPPESSGSANPAPGGRPPGAPADSIEVWARHATQDVRIRILLPPRARFRHVKQAIARCLGSDEVIQKGLLTSRIRGVYKAFKDDALVGNVTEVTVACADFSLGGGTELEIVYDSGDIGADSDAALTGGSAHAQQASGMQARASAASSHTASKPTKVATTPGMKGSRITKRQAINLLSELREGFSADEFRTELAELVRRRAAGWGGAEFQRERQELFLSVQSLVLPKYGFDGTPSGVYRMMGAMGSFVEDPEFSQLAADVNELLGINAPPETWGSLSKSCRGLEPPREQPRDAERARRRPAPPPSLMCRVPPPPARHGWVPPGAPGGGQPEGGSQRLGARAPAPVPPPGFDRWPVGKYRPFRLFVAGTWNDFCPAEMHWQNGLFVSPVTVGSSGWESFQILKDGSWSATIYPSVPDAGPFAEHSVCGPDGQGHGKNWQIGRFIEEEVVPGTQFAIVATVDKEGCVKLVHWEHLA
uniref:Protein C10 n=1 Tax=Alexandrium monilatum TaxID=311494 RepID=A0A7S4SL03_9DINO